MRFRLLTSDHVRNFIFGVEDSLVSTVGLISGIAITDMPRAAILVTGVVLIFVEAFSMSVGSLLSDNSAREFERKKYVSLKTSLASSFIMFLSYFLSGFIIIAPYMFFENAVAMPMSIALSLLALFILGLATGRVTYSSPLKKGLTMMVIGGMAVLVGTIVGLLFK